MDPASRRLGRLSIAQAMPILQRLAGQGRLVPFLGSGMSRPTCVTWDGFVLALEQAAGTQAGQSVTGADLATRAWHAIRRLRTVLPPAQLQSLIASSIRPAGASGPMAVPPALAILAATRWPLVLTMNYDALWLDACRARRKHAPCVLGRQEDECWRVLRSLQHADDPILWAIHGRLDRPDELLVGQDDYQQAIHRQPYFRRTLATVLRQRSLLFLGTRMDDPHVNGLLDEDAAHLGASTTPHFALVPADECPDHLVDFLVERRGVAPIVFHKESGDQAYRQVEEFLAALGAPAAPAPAGLHAGSGGDTTPISIRWGPIVPGQLGPTDRRAIGVSCGNRTQRWHPGESALGILRRGQGPLPAAADGAKVRVAGADEIAPQVQEVVFLLCSQRRIGQRDLGVIHGAVRTVLEMAAAQGLDSIHLPVMGGGRGRQVAPLWYLMAMLTGAAAARSSCRCVIHVIDEWVWSELATGRVDLPMLAGMDEAMPLWLQHGRAGERTRHLRWIPRDAVPADLEREFGTLPTACWPPLSLADAGGETAEPITWHAERSLVAHGVLPGGTLIWP